VIWPKVTCVLVIWPELQVIDPVLRTDQALALALATVPCHSMPVKSRNEGFNALDDVAGNMRQGMPRSSGA
jgi:hypothetical protein